MPGENFDQFQRELSTLREEVERRIKLLEDRLLSRVQATEANHAQTIQLIQKQLQTQAGEMHDLKNDVANLRETAHIDTLAITHMLGVIGRHQGVPDEDLIPPVPATKKKARR